MEKTIIVIGDVMLDVHTFGKIDRINPEAPVPILTREFDKKSLGGAGNLVVNLKNLGVDVTLLTAIGTDSEGDDIKQLVEDLNIKTLFVQDGRPTTIKQRFIADTYNQQVLRVDREVTTQLSSEYVDNLIKYVKEKNPTIVVLSDYNKGVVGKYLIENLKKNYSGKILIDPKKFNLGYYNDLFLVKYNINSAQQRLNKSIDYTNESQLKSAAKELALVSNSNIIITLAEKGSVLYDKENDFFYKVNSSLSEVHDVSGAGDTFLSALTYAVLNDYSLKNALELANKASGIVVGKVGTVPITYKELFDDKEEK